MRLLTPTGNRRLNELVGFLAITLAVLAALALLSYSPRDRSFNVAAPRISHRRMTFIRWRKTRLAQCGQPADLSGVRL